MFSKEKTGEGRMDLESLETHIRDSMHGVGAVMLENLLNAGDGDYKGRTMSCGNGHVFEFVEYRDKDLLTVLGNVMVKRTYLGWVLVGYYSIAQYGILWRAGIREPIGQAAAESACLG